MNEKQEIEKLRTELFEKNNKIIKLSADYIKATTALIQKVVKKIRSESCETESAYHFSMNKFKDLIFLNIENIDKKQIISDTTEELIVAKTFKNVFINELRELYAKKYNLL